MVAVNPGTAPTNNPNSAAPNIETRVCHPKTSPKAVMMVSMGGQNAKDFSTPQGSGTRSIL